MAYQKQNFVNGEVLNADKLNHIEDGIDWEIIKPTGGVNTDNIADEAITESKIKKGAVTQIKSGIIYASSWSGTTEPYFTDITIYGITEDDTPIVGVVYSNNINVAKAQKDAWSCVYKINTALDGLRIYAFEKPTTDIPIQVMWTRK